MLFLAFLSFFLSSGDKGFWGMWSFVPVFRWQWGRWDCKSLDMLFQNFSWQDFLLVAAALSMLWYVLVWVFFFRGRPGVVGASAGRGADVFDGEQEGLLGRPVMAEGERVVGADEFGFAGADQLEQLGVVADVQEQLRVTCRELESSVADKEEFLSVIAGVLKDYPVPLSSRLPLEEFIREHLPFFVSGDELDGLWS